jgi:hypothetical protein
VVEHALADLNNFLAQRSMRDEIVGGFNPFGVPDV